MDLRDFIKTSLVDIMRGVQDAQAEINNDPMAIGAINPAFGELKDTMTRVAFDVAVTVSSETKADGKAGIDVYALKVGGGASKQMQDSSVSRLQFEVPIAPSTLKVESPANTTGTLALPDIGVV